MANRTISTKVLNVVYTTDQLARDSFYYCHK